MRTQRIVILVCLGAAWLFGLPELLAQEPESSEMGAPDRLAVPTLPANPGQADHGAVVYYYFCMVCHGDRGQGLTEEFLLAWAPEDRNCWQAKCHGAIHPPDGFQLAPYVPAVVGEDTLAQSLNARQLHSYLKSTMPWHNPGRLSDEEYWQVTAFLLRENGVNDGQTPLGPAEATGVAQAPPGSPAADLGSATPPHPPAGETGVPGLGPAVAIGLVVTLALAWAILRAARRRET